MAAIATSVLDVRASSDAREMVTADRAKELLSGAFDDESSHSYSCVSLCGKSYSREASVVVAEALKSASVSPSATDFDFADIIAGRPEDEALEVLTTIIGALDAEKVIRLDLSDNALGEKGVRALMDMIGAMVNLKSLKFHNNGLSELSVSLIADCLKKPCSIEQLEFDNNMSGSGGAVAVAGLLPSCPNLTVFRMSSSRVRPDGGEALCKGLASMQPGSLRTLDLSDSMFGGETGVALADALRNHNQLAHVSLSDSGIEEDGLEAVLEALSEESTAPEMASLNLSCLELGVDHCDALVSIVRSKKTSLVDLTLDDNEFDSEGACALAAALTESGCAVKGTLRIRSNMMGSSGALALARIAPCGSTLDVDGNQISEKGVERLRAILASRGATLGPLDENEPDMDEDEDEEGDDAAPAPDDDGEVDALTAALQKTL